MQLIHAHELAELVEYGEAEAFADMFDASPEYQGQRVERIAGAYALIAPTMPLILFNRVLGLGLKESIHDDVLHRITVVYRNAGVKSWAIQIAPDSLNEQTEKRFAAHGLARHSHWEKVYREAVSDIHINTDLSVRRIDVDMAEAYADVCLIAFGMPPALKSGLVALVGRQGWQHFMAFDGEMPVACGALFARNGVGWLGQGGTLPSHRRRGAQGEIMAMRVREAQAAGCAWVITETGADTPEHPNPSFHNMLRTGFRHAYQRPEFIFETPA